MASCRKNSYFADAKKLELKKFRLGIYKPYKKTSVKNITFILFNTPPFICIK